MQHPTQTTAGFDSLGLPSALVATLAKQGYQQPTAIQAGTIPVLLAGRDAVGIAQTGTGKTASFALPILADIDPSRRLTQALILCPTRELSIQVAESFESYARHLNGLRVLTVCGGGDMRNQLRALKDGVHIIVATPGRLLDHLNRGTADLSGITTVVLDEADEMLRMGFIDDVDTILAKTPSERRVALFSATMPPRIRQIAQKHLKNPVEVAVSQASSTNDNIEQHYWFVKGASKIEALRRILAYEQTDGVIVFTRTRESTATVAEQLREAGFNAAPLNGDMDQKLRVRTVDQLKSGSLDILVATDVAARGLDVERVTHVINHDIPFDEEAYVHRIGRTGRAGRTGKAILFVTGREKRLLRNIERLTQKPIPEMTLPSERAIAKRKLKALIQRIETQMTTTAPESVVEMIDELQLKTGADYRDIAIALATLTGEAAVTGKQTKTVDSQNKSAQVAKAESKQPRDKLVDQPKNRRERREKARTDTPLGAARPLKAHPEIPMERFRIAVGQQHGVQAREIVGAVANEAGIEGEFIGMISIQESYSTIDLPEGMPKAILKHLRKTRIKGVSLDMARVG
jgi:ATP-dependent RNA helicase DeaD